MNNREHEQSARRELKRTFDDIAQAYDEQRRKLIPCFDDFYQIGASVANVATDAPRILDIGAGTGLFASFLLAKYPKAKLTLIDLSDKMLEVARARFRHRPDVKYFVDDFTAHPFHETFDIVISSLSIHHLTDAEKRDVYAKVFASLSPGGLFVNADQVLGSTPFLESLYKTDWQTKVENSGLSAQEIASAYERTKLDRMSPLAEQMRWLNDIGFADVDCIYKYFNFVVLFARKME